ncbi:AraC family transcriptional regulator [Enterococcus sp. 669A]|uniref:AraC family transcriptional regulator n=1 Tax=Candidatus Enterococcus moelleringii TaxID=2815325 RepID=A0ABS3LC82_9ENTE|nr:AraC family transcriptional regulator [Enterococcus sp. 669A]MBO1307240.1 AraC family transcriptional regulator [Enterococcus sp. 669A]
MKTWQSIQQVLDYIEANLDQSLPITELAAIAYLSPFYFQRLFKKLVGRPVMEYVKLRRLAKSCQLLATTDQRIIEIALTVGFNSHAYYTKAFKSAYGMTPDEYRLNQPALHQMLKPDLTMKQTVIAENDSFIAENMVVTITRRQLTKPEYYQGVVGKMLIANNIPVGGATGMNQADGIWTEFHKLKKQRPELFTEDIQLGASFLKDPSVDPTSLAPTESFDYFAGGRVETLDEHLETWIIPPGEYIVCGCEAENTPEARNIAIAKALGYLLGTWLPSQQLVTEPYSLEKYFPAKNPNTVYQEIWVAPLQI